jgi:glucose/arabinose dehydrogenase
MAFGPDARLYAATANQGVLSFTYARKTHQLSDMRKAVNNNALGIGFNHDTMYLSSGGNLVRLTDNNSNGVWGESGETNVNIVEGIPTGDHAVDHIKIRRNTLFVGIGTRTIDGYNEIFTPPYDSLGESSYGGSISWIQNLKAVPSIPNAAQLRDENGNLLSNTDFITNGSPYTSRAKDKLVVHSSGARNPFGLAFDANGNLWMTNNYDRANSTADGQSIPSPGDVLDNDLSDDVYDQFFLVKYKGDYGFANSNWRNNPIATAAGFFNANRVYSTTFDNLNPSDPRFHILYDPNNPDGLGPSASADGFDFYKGKTLGSQFFNKAFISRWNNLVQTPDGQETITYADVVLVDPVTGQVSQVASGFNNPLDVLADENGLFVADYNGGIYYISSALIAN